MYQRMWETRETSGDLVLRVEFGQGNVQEYRLHRTVLVSSSGFFENWLDKWQGDGERAAKKQRLEHPQNGLPVATLGLGDDITQRAFDLLLQ